MLTLLTSCNRHDLLEQTLTSLRASTNKHLLTIINEDSHVVPTFEHESIVYMLGGVGLKRSIQTFFDMTRNDYKGKYYLHCEDDWLFNSEHQNWVQDSVDIMERNPDIIKVVAKGEFIHDTELRDGVLIRKPTIFFDTRWHGFTWNCGVTRYDILKDYNFTEMDEKELDNRLYLKGYKTAYLPYELYTHTGGERSVRCE